MVEVGELRAEREIENEGHYAGGKFTRSLR
jgi:hypothetical protein